MKHVFPVRGLLVVSAGLLLAPAAPAETPDLESLAARLKALESQVELLQKENQALRQQLPAPEAKAKAAPVLVVPQGKETKLSLGGYLHLNAESGAAADSRFPDNDRLLLRKIRFGVKGSFAEPVEFLLQADLGNNSLNSTSAYRVQATDVYVLWKAHPAANITVGQFKTPYGYEQLISETKTISIERTLANDSLTLGRQAGAMVSGDALEKKLSYAVAVTNGLSANTSFNDNEQFAYVGRIAATVYEEGQLKVSLGTNAFSTRDTGGTFTGRRRGEGFDAQLRFAGAELDAELLQTQYNRDVGVDYESRGWSIMGSYFFVPNRWQALLRYETYDPSDVAQADRTNLTTIGLNYFIKGDDLKLSLNYLIGDPPNTHGHQDRLLARLQVIF